MEKKLANIEAKSLLAMCYILDDYERLKEGVEELTEEKLTLEKKLYKDKREEVKIDYY